jgi:hypothetical protein
VICCSVRTKTSCWLKGICHFNLEKDFKFKHFHSHVLTNHFENVLGYSTLNLEDCERSESKSDFKNGKKFITMCHVNLVHLIG